MRNHAASKRDVCKQAQIHRLSPDLCTCLPMNFCPWNAADRLGVAIIPDRLDHALGYTDGHSRIWVDHRLTYAQARCALTHELVHVTHGHTTHQPEYVEAMVRCQTARWLVPWHRLLTALGDQLTPEHVAEELNVTVEVLADRINHATPQELAQLERHPSCADSAA